MNSQFSDEIINKVWDKGVVVAGYDATLFRKDSCGAWIVRSEYGKTSPYGWEIDHVYPQARGGDDNVLNLRPMHWENNRSKSDDYPSYVSALCAEENRNVRKTGVFTINEKLRSLLNSIYNIEP